MNGLRFTRRAWERAHRATHHADAGSPGSGSTRGPLRDFCEFPWGNKFPGGEPRNKINAARHTGRRFHPSTQVRPLEKRVTSQRLRGTQEVLNLPWPPRRQLPTEQNGILGILKSGGGNLLDSPVRTVGGALATEKDLQRGPKCGAFARHAATRPRSKVWNSTPRPTGPAAYVTRAPLIGGRQNQRILH